MKCEQGTVSQRPPSVPTAPKRAAEIFRAQECRDVQQLRRSAGAHGRCSLDQLRCLVHVGASLRYRGAGALTTVAEGAPQLERVSCLRWKNFGLMPTNVWTGLEPPERKESARFSCRWPGRGLRPLPGARMRRSSPRLLTCAMTKTKRNQVRAR